MRTNQPVIQSFVSKDPVQHLHSTLSLHPIVAYRRLFFYPRMRQLTRELTRYSKVVAKCHPHSPEKKVLRRPPFFLGVIAVTELVMRAWFAHIRPCLTDQAKRKIPFFRIVS